MLREQQKKALKAMESGKNVFLSGEAGTGKSFVLRQFVEQHKSKEMIICAPTGIAALNIGGVTLHRAFGAPVRPIHYTELGKYSDVIAEAEMIIIDEISMCRADLFEFVAKSILEAERISGKHKQVIVVGDFFQLPPVFPEKDKKLLPELSGSGFAFTAPSWHVFNFETIVLNDIVRQSDIDFVQALNSVRCGDKTSIKWINTHTSVNENLDAIYVCGKNKQAKEINLRKIRGLEGKEYIYRATIDGDVLDSDKPTEDELHLKVGAKVMTLTNTKEYQNGSICTIKKCYSDHIIVLLEDGQETEIDFFTWEIVEYKHTKQEIVKDVIGKFSQLPVKLAYAVTIHKSQGQTYDAINLYPGCFAAGQLYVGLSRCKSLNQLHLMQPISNNDLIVAPEVISFYENVTKSNIELPETENENVTNSNNARKRGGKRKGAGRKAKHGKTIVMRVPEELVDEIQKLIRKHYET